MNMLIHAQHLLYIYIFKNFVPKSQPTTIGCIFPHQRMYSRKLPLRHALQTNLIYKPVFWTVFTGVYVCLYACRSWEFGIKLDNYLIIWRMWKSIKFYERFLKVEDRVKIRKIKHRLFPYLNCRFQRASRKEKREMNIEVHMYKVHW